MKNATGARNSAIGTFTAIARENYQKMLVLESRQQATWEKLGKSSPEEKRSIESDLIKLQGEAEKSAVIVIVFSAIAIEAYIYDYASRNLSDSYVQNHLDKIDPVSKWVIIPRLVTGKELPREHKWFELIKKLVQQRNAIIHHKSSSPPYKYDDAIAYYKKLQQNSTQMYTTAKEALELFDLLLNEMKCVDPEEIIWIDSYLFSHPENSFEHLEEP